MKLSVVQSGEYRVEESAKPAREKGKVLFRVKAAGICGSDIPRIFAGKSYYYPIVLGHEFSGVVEEAEDASLVGKRAVVFPIIPCGKCEYCKKHQYANCKNYSYFGSRTDGGMQTYLNVAPFHLIPIPDGIPDATAAMTEPCAVCLHAIKKAGITSDSHVKVYGAGTIGLLLAMWAKAKGANDVTVSDINPQRVEFANKLGFPAVSGTAPDVIFDATGAGEAIADAIGEIAAFGKLVLVGNASGDVTLTVPVYSQILRKQLTVMGSWNSDFNEGENDWAEALDAMAKGILHPEYLITSRFPLSEGVNAFNRIRDREFDEKIILEDEK